MCKNCLLLLMLLPVVFANKTQAQINSPYSRYGLGDLYNSRNVVNRGMGNIAVAYSDYQSVNYLNPAAYSQLQTVTFDVGLEMELRSLQNPEKTQRDQSAYLQFNYVALGIPLAKDKKGFTRWGLALGLRPFSRVSYTIRENERLPGIDSSQVFFKGTGGGYRAFLGTGYRLGNFSLGVNAGFLFGQQDLTTQRTFVNDTVFYMNSLQETKTAYSRFGVDGGFQYKIPVSKTSFLRLGATGFIGNNVTATQDGVRQTFFYNGTGGTDSIDVVERLQQVEGTIEMPSGYNVGLTFEKEGSWLLSAEYEAVSWSNFRFMGRSQPLANSSVMRFGGHIIPSNTDNNNYFKRVAYRAGFYTGKDFVVANGVQLPVWAATVGFGLPIRRYNYYSNQYTSINLAFEWGRRGNQKVPIRESFFRINVGLALSDLWFQKRKFD